MRKLLDTVELTARHHELVDKYERDKIETVQVV